MDGFMWLSIATGASLGLLGLGISGAAWRIKSRRRFDRWFITGLWIACTGCVVMFAGVVAAAAHSLMG